MRYWFDQLPDGHTLEETVKESEPFLGLSVYGSEKPIRTLDDALRHHLSSEKLEGKTPGNGKVASKADAVPKRLKCSVFFFGKRADAKAVNVIPEKLQPF